MAEMIWRIKAKKKSQDQMKFKNWKFEIINNFDDEIIEEVVEEVEVEVIVEEEEIETVPVVEEVIDDIINNNIISTQAPECTFDYNCGDKNACQNNKCVEVDCIYHSHCWDFNLCENNKCEKDLSYCNWKWIDKYHECKNDKLLLKTMDYKLWYSLYV